MAIYNRVTGERKLVGKIISERGTFRMDAAHDEIVFWNDETNEPDVMYLCQGDWYVERGQDLDEETFKKYEDHCKRRIEFIQNYQESCDKLTIKEGSNVLVFKGRKVPKGTTGKVIYKHETQFGPSVLIEVADQKVWVSLVNCMVDVNGIWFYPRG